MLNLYLFKGFRWPFPLTKINKTNKTLLDIQKAKSRNSQGAGILNNFRISCSMTILKISFVGKTIFFASNPYLIGEEVIMYVLANLHNLHQPITRPNDSRMFNN